MQVASYRPAFEYPPPRIATEQVTSFQNWTIPTFVISKWQALPPAALSNPLGFVIPQGSWGRLDTLVFSLQMAAAYLGVAGQYVAFQLLLNGVAIPGYDNIYMPAPQSDGISSVVQLPATLVVQPGAVQTITVNVTVFAGGNANYGSALVHGWTWSDAQDKKWRMETEVPE